MRTTIYLPDKIHELVRYLAASRGETLGTTIAAILEETIDTEHHASSGARRVQLDSRSGLLSVAGGPIRQSADVRTMAYDE